MSTQTTTAVRKTVTVEAPIDHAFEVFTTGFDRWWPRAHHLGDVDLAEVVIEPQVGGRWYQRAVDGSECDWGEVVAWEPPHRVAMTWTITPDFEPATDPTRAATVEVRFTAESPTSTRVDFEHRDLDRLGSGWERLRESVEPGWSELLALYVALARIQVR